MEEQLFLLFGGWVGLQKTPARAVLRQSLRIAAKNKVETAQNKETKRKQEEAEREAKAAQSKQRR